VQWTAELQRGADLPVFEAGRVLGRVGEDARTAVLALPTLHHDLAVAAVRIVVDLINRGLEGPSSPADLAAAARPAIDRLTEVGRGRGHGSSNMIKFLEAAHQRCTPWLHLAGNTFQLGYGARARWLEASFTDATPRIGAALARDKFAAASLMRQAGLPVPAHEAVRTEDAAVKAAEALGYPVVVKPFDTDGGLAVSAGVKHQAGVRKAFAEAKAHSEVVLIETFVVGRDYRLVVFQGRLIWALERIPGGVTGDGRRTVRQLVDQFNADIPRAKGGWGAVTRLNFDEEAVEMLAERGLDADFVPAEGERVRLRGAANVSRGGTPVGVFDKVHPDNKRLAERAAQALRLDIAGVDLIIPDIGRSWKETGAGVCEVNAQPTLGVRFGHLYEEILQGLLRGDGRIPIALIVGAPAGSRACALVARSLAAAGLRVGTATPDEVRIGGESLLAGPADPFFGARLLIGDDTVEAAVVAVNDLRPLTTGLPFDRCSLVALAGSHLAGVADAGQALDRLAGALLPLSLGKVVVNAGDPACLSIGSRVTGGRVILYAAGAGVPQVLEHCARGGAGVWVDDSGDGPRLVAAAGSHRTFDISLGGPGRNDEGLACEAEDIALAGAVASALGCGEAHLRQALGEARLHPSDTAALGGISV
jgi:cyanophycin synthetase